MGSICHVQIDACTWATNAVHTSIEVKAAHALAQSAVRVRTTHLLSHSNPLVHDELPLQDLSTTSSCTMVKSLTYRSGSFAARWVRRCTHTA